MNWAVGTVWNVIHWWTSRFTVGFFTTGSGGLDSGQRGSGSGGSYSANPRETCKLLQSISKIIQNITGVGKYLRLKEKITKFCRYMYIHNRYWFISKIR